LVNRNHFAHAHEGTNYFCRFHVHTLREIADSDVLGYFYVVYHFACGALKAMLFIKGVFHLAVATLPRFWPPRRLRRREVLRSSACQLASSAWVTILEPPSSLDFSFFLPPAFFSSSLRFSSSSAKRLASSAVLRA